MTATQRTTTSTTAGSGRPPAALRLVHSEFLKLRTLHSWWIFALIALALTGLTFLINMLRAIFFFELAENSDLPEQEAEGVQTEGFLTQTDPVYQAANLYTSGQLLVLIVVLVMGVLIVTNEFHHQTATATFLVTPHRTAVILAKVAVAAGLGGLYWLLSTLLNLPLTAIFLHTQGFEAYLTNPDVVRAILLNLAAYVLWAGFGVGFGVLLRSQVLATVIGIVLYLAGYLGGSLVFNVLALRFDAEWIREAQVIMPSIASQLMVAGEQLPGDPPQWVGAVVLVGWAVVAGAIGILITRQRDVT